MDMSCPKCLSQQVISLNKGEKIGSAIGTTCGAICGVASFLTDTRQGEDIGTCISGALLAGIASGTTAGLAGATFGKLIDECILENYYCPHCHCRFSKSNC